MGNSIEGGFQRVPPLYLRDLRKKTDKRYRSFVMASRTRSPSIVEKEIELEKINRELTSESVSEFIITNPDFLDNFVSGYISQDRVRAWLKEPSDDNLENIETPGAGDEDHNDSLVKLPGIEAENPPETIESSQSASDLSSIDTSGRFSSSDVTLSSDTKTAQDDEKVKLDNVSTKANDLVKKTRKTDKTKNSRWNASFSQHIAERGFRQRRLMLITRSRFLYPFKYRHEELTELIERPLSGKFNELNSHLFPYTEIKSDDISKVFIQMVTNLLGKHAFPMGELCYFLTTLKANYNNVEYHNYKHALSHAQSMYWMLKKNPGVFTELEMKALLIASLSHDVAHPGQDEFYMKKVYSNMQDMYDTPLLENHHFQTCLLILQDIKCNVFCDLDSDDYKLVLEDMKHAILSTTIDRYKIQVEKLRQLVDAGINLDKGYVRKSVKSLMMMACDLCGTWKRWEEHKNIVWSLYMEYYNQSDKEMNLGIQSPPFRLRTNADNIPQSQVGFMETIALPIFKLLADIFPTLRSINKSSKENLECWKTYK